MGKKKRFLLQKCGRVPTTFSTTFSTTFCYHILKKETHKYWYVSYDMQRKEKKFVAVVLQRKVYIATVQYPYKSKWCRGSHFLSFSFSDMIESS